jgi:hypothetical protein
MMPFRRALGASVVGVVVESLAGCTGYERWHVGSALALPHHGTGVGR